MEQTARRLPETGTVIGVATTLDERARAQRHLAVVDSAAEAYRAAARASFEPDPRRSAQHLLMAVGSAMHLFSEPLTTFSAVDRVDLLRATSVLTKQIDDLIDANDPLRDLAALVTDPDRTALHDGTSAAVFCGTSWPVVCAIATERVQASIDGASAFGPEAVFHLAATRAAGTRRPWWGTRRWIELVERAELDDRTTELLLTAPERVPTGLLAQVISGSWEASEPDHGLR